MWLLPVVYFCLLHGSLGIDDADAVNILRSSMKLVESLQLNMNSADKKGTFKSGNKNAEESMHTLAQLRDNLNVVLDYAEKMKKYCETSSAKMTAKLQQNNETIQELRTELVETKKTILSSEFRRDTCLLKEMRTSQLLTAEKKARSSCEHKYQQLSASWHSFSMSCVATMKVCWELGAEMDDIKKELAKAASETAALKSANNELVNSLKDKDMELNTTSTALQASRKESKAINTRLESAVKEQNRTANELANVNSGLRKLQKKLEDRATELKATTADLLQARNLSKALNSSLVSMKLDCDAAKRKMNASLVEQATAVTQCEKASKKSSAQISDLEMKLSDTTKTMAELESNLTSALAKRDEVIRANEEAQSRLIKLNETLETRMQQCNASISQYENNTKASDVKLAELEGNLAASTKKAHELESEITALKTSKSSVEAERDEQKRAKEQAERELQTVKTSLQSKTQELDSAKSASQSCNDLSRIVLGVNELILQNTDVGFYIDSPSSFNYQYFCPTPDCGMKKLEIDEAMHWRAYAENIANYPWAVHERKCQRTGQLKLSKLFVRAEKVELAQTTLYEQVLTVETGASNEYFMNGYVAAAERGCDCLINPVPGARPRVGYCVKNIGECGANQPLIKIECADGIKQFVKYVSSHAAARRAMHEGCSYEETKCYIWNDKSSLVVILQLMHISKRTAYFVLHAWEHANG